jgi:hypothetical protein
MDVQQAIHLATYGRLLKQIFNLLIHPRQFTWNRPEVAPRMLRIAVMMPSNNSGGLEFMAGFQFSESWMSCDEFLWCA